MATLTHTMIHALERLAPASWWRKQKAATPRWGTPRWGKKVRTQTWEALEGRGLVIRFARGSKSRELTSSGMLVLEAYHLALGYGLAIGRSKGREEAARR